MTRTSATRGHSRAAVAVSSAMARARDSRTRGDTRIRDLARASRLSGMATTQSPAQPRRSDLTLLGHLPRRRGDDVGRRDHALGAEQSLDHLRLDELPLDDDLVDAPPGDEGLLG